MLCSMSAPDATDRLARLVGVYDADGGDDHGCLSISGGANEVGLVVTDEGRHVLLLTPEALDACEGSQPLHSRVHRLQPVSRHQPSTDEIPARHVARNLIAGRLSRAGACRSCCGATRRRR
jgi:hypothetical protein